MRRAEAPETAMSTSRYQLELHLRRPGDEGRRDVFFRPLDSLAIAWRLFDAHKSEVDRNELLAAVRLWDLRDRSFAAAGRPRLIASTG